MMYKHAELFNDLSAIARKHNVAIVFSKEMSEQRVRKQLDALISVWMPPNEIVPQKLVILKMRKPTANQLEYDATVLSI